VNNDILNWLDAFGNVVIAVQFIDLHFTTPYAIRFHTFTARYGGTMLMVVSFPVNGWS
jgi:hypothetical protein